MKRLKGLSLFANVGVAEAYLEDVGVDILIANELEEKRAEFYKHLYPKTNMIVGDITNEEIRKQIIEEAIKSGVDFIIATPPCQGMSVAGKLDPLDPRNQLIYFAVEVIKQVKPKFILLENVPQQLKTKIKYNEELISIPDYIKKELENDYNFNKEPLVKAMNYGVPQIRQRSIFLMSRKDMSFTWEFPEEDDSVVTLKEALWDLPSLDPIVKEGYDQTIELFPDFEKKKRDSS